MATMTTESDTAALLSDLHAAGVQTSICDGKLTLEHASKLTADLKRRVVEHKAELLAALSNAKPNTMERITDMDEEGLTAVEQAELWRNEWKTKGYPPGIRPATT